MKIDGDIKAFATKASSHREVVTHAGEAGPFWKNDELVKVRVASQYRRCSRLNEVRQM